ncbi:hypothetical protein ACRALDRAFT_1082111 [Sodiomyces alcalophilus JCM 7366]|uniref:uncharacterized protein n=1 Tax=Sodiomyces alcalophilus JCM 7366 TaxID=591952 RepID=UPI0039B51EAA
MEPLFDEFAAAYMGMKGYDLAQTLSPIPPADKPDRLRAVWLSTNHYGVKDDVTHGLVQALTSRSGYPREEVKDELKGWTEIFTAYWKAIGELLAVDGDSIVNGRASSWTKVYEAWKEMTMALHRGYTNHNFEAWTIPCLYTAGKYLRAFAIKSDEERSHNDAGGDGLEIRDDFDPEMEKHQQLRDCEQQLKRIFTLCLTDRAEITESRKWGIYAIINLLFKTYFKLNSANLARTILKALSTNKGNMPPLEAFPAAQRVTFKYYEGVLSFLEENYVEAEKHLDEAWKGCKKDAMSNKDKTLLEPFPRLQKIFLPLAQCIKRGDLHGFDLALQQGEEEVYLTLERGRDIALRNLLRKVFLAKGFEEPKNPGDAPIRKTRIRVAEFGAAISLGNREAMDSDEVECLLANMIYKNLMKGYISREHGIVVLSKNGAFPGTGV